MNTNETFTLAAMRDEQPCRFTMYGDSPTFHWATTGMRSPDVAAVLATIGFSADDAAGVIDAAVAAYPERITI